MKHVLVIDESPLLREYLRAKLTENGLEASVAINGLDGIAKILNLMPDLVIMDYHLTRKTCMEVLEEKKRSPNTVNIPVIIAAQRIDQKHIIELVNYNVKKVFTKPIRIDALFKTMSDILGVEMDMDKTPSIVEVHVNDNILFVEIAQGLNREKLELLRYKIAELIALYEIRTSKVLVMLSDMTLGFADGPNIKHLLDTVISASKAKLRNIKIITRDTFLRDYVAGQKDYSDIEVVSNLQYALEGLLSDLDPKMEFGEKKAEIIGNRILSSTGDNRQETVHLRFDAETRKTTDLTEIKESGKGLRIAAVDDDFVIQELIKMTFTEVGATVTTFDDGSDFLEVAGKEDFDLVFLDLLMPKVSGFEVLAELKQKDIDLPIIVLSAVTKRDAVVKSFQSGVKSYLVKPLKPDAILKKAIEILKPNF